MTIETASATHGDVREEEAPLFVEPVQSDTASMTEPEPAVESQPKPLTLFKPKAEPPVEPQPEPQEEPKLIVMAETKVAPSPTYPAQTSKPKKETPRPAVPTISPAAERIVTYPVYPSTPSTFRKDYSCPVRGAYRTRSGRVWGSYLSSTVSETSAKKSGGAGS